MNLEWVVSLPIALGIIGLIVWRGFRRDGLYSSEFWFAGVEGTALIPVLLVADATVARVEAAGLLIVVAFLSFWLATTRWTARTREQYADQDTGGIPATLFFSVAILAGLLGVIAYQGPPPIVQVLVTDFPSYDMSRIQGALGEARVETTKSGVFGGVGAIGSAAFFIQVPLWHLVGAIAGHRLQWQYTLKVRAAALFVAFAGLMFVGGVGQRFQILTYVLTIFIASAGRSRRRLAGVIYVLAIAVVAVLAVAPLSGQLSELDSDDAPGKLVLDSLSERIVRGNGYNSILTMDFVDQGRLPTGNGRYHWEKIASSAPGVQAGIPLAAQLQELKHPERPSTTFAALTPIGWFYADYGWLGVIAGYLLIGVTLRSITAMKLAPYGVSDTPLRAATATTALHLALGSLPGYLSQILILVAAWIGVLCVARLLRFIDRGWRRPSAH